MSLPVRIIGYFGVVIWPVTTLLFSVMDHRMFRQWLPQLTRYSRTRMILFSVLSSLVIAVLCLVIAIVILGY